MSKIERRDIGYAHSRLRDVARQLRTDGHDDAASYARRADTEQAVYEDLVSLAERGYTEGAKDIDSWKIGANLVDYLLERGWTPPAHFADRIVE